MNDSLRKLQTVTLKDAAGILSINIRTLQRLIASGAFPKPIKVGACSRILVEDLERFVERRRREKS